MRPKSTTGDLTEIEIGLLYGRDGFGLIDAKTIAVVNSLFHQTLLLTWQVNISQTMRDTKAER